MLSGQGVISSRALIHINLNSLDRNDLEHVGSLYLMKNPNKFRWVGLNIPQEFNKRDYRVTVDESEDLELIRSIYSDLWDGKNIIAFQSLLNWFDINHLKLKINSKVKDSKINQTVRKIKKNLQQKLVCTYEWDDI